MLKATYRLQFRNGVGFREAAAIAPHLAAAGVSHLYASPIFAATTGSTHGYDVTDHTAFDPTLGGEAGFAELAGALRDNGLKLLIDIVPNHMAASSENPWWRDVLENGRGSAWAGHFDIDWSPPKPDLAGKVLLPVLGDQFGRVLERELAVRFEAGAFQVRHGETAFPLAPRSWTLILEPADENQIRAVGEIDRGHHQDGLPVFSPRNHHRSNRTRRARDYWLRITFCIGLPLASSSMSLSR